MKNNRTTALLMLLVFLLVVAVVIIFLTGLDRNTRTDNPYENVTVTAAPDLPEESAEPTPPPTSVPTTAPQYYPPTTATPVQTAAPVSTGAPKSAATPEPTPSPTPASLADGGILPAQQLIPVVPGVNDNTGDGGDSAVTIPIGTVIGSGQFRSDTGTALNIHADWTASINDPQTANVTVTVFADHYSLITTATPGALQVSVDGQYVSLGSPAIENDGTTGLAMTEINSHTFQVPLTSGDIRTVPVQVVWQYRGTYSGVDLPTIECGGNITLTR